MKGSPWDEYACRSNLAQAMAELGRLGEAWLEARAAGRDTEPIAAAIDEATRATRRYERQLRRRGLGP